MVSLKKRVPPPLKEPGTHTNAEVKEALHARAQRRSIVVLALVILLLASLVVVSNTAAEYTEESTGWAPRVVVLSVSGLSANMMDRAMAGNKAPFLSLLTSSGGAYGSVSVSHAADQSPLVPLLTGNATTDATSLAGSTTFLAELKKAGFSPIVVAPETYYSGSTTVSGDNSTECTQVGILDTECAGTACPTNENRFCAVSRQYISCSGVNCLYQGDVTTAVTKMVKNSAAALFVQIDAFSEETTSDDATNNTLSNRSRANLIDDLVGMLALSLAERTSSVSESWLVIVTGDGDAKSARGPLAMAAYANGELVRLNAIPSTAAATDIRGTILKWFGLTPDGVDQARNLGICSTGAAVKNCN